MEVAVGSIEELLEDAESGRWGVERDGDGVVGEMLGAPIETGVFAEVELVSERGLESERSQSSCIEKFAQVSICLSA